MQRLQLGLRTSAGHRALEQLDARNDDGGEEGGGGLAGVSHVLQTAEAACESLHGLQQLLAALETVVHAAEATEVGVALQLTLAEPQSQHMTRLDAPTRDLGEEVVERVVAARDDQNTLLGEAAVEVADDLHDHVGLAGARRPHHQRQARAHSAADGLHLRGREAERVFHDRVGERGQFGRSVGVCVGRSICGDDNLLRFLLAFLIVRRESDTERRLRRRLRQLLAILRPERHHILRKRLHHMSRIHKSVGEVDRRSLRRHSRVLRSSRVSESQQHSLQPSRHRSLSLGGHLQLSRRRQHGLEGVAGRVTSHQQVEGGVGVFDLPFRHARHVPLVLRRVQSHLQPPLLPRTLLADVRR